MEISLPSKMLQKLVLFGLCFCLLVFTLQYGGILDLFFGQHLHLIQM